MTLIERIRERLDIPGVLSHRGVHLRRGRGACPLCSASNTTTFLVSADGKRWRCFRCQRHGDVIDVIAELDGVPAGEAIRRCAALAGVDPDQRETAAEQAERGRLDEERQHREAERRARHAEHRARWRELIHESDRARAEAEKVAARLLIQTDPDERGPRTTRALDELGDPHLAEQLAHVRLDDLEMEWCAMRHVHGDPSVSVARAIEEAWLGWRAENAVDRMLGDPNAE